MGVWGPGPFSNDTAADWSWRFNAGAFDDPRPVDLDTGVKLLSEALSCSATDDYGLLCAYAAVAVLTALATAHSWPEDAVFAAAPEDPFSTMSEPVFGREARGWAQTHLEGFPHQTLAELCGSVFTLFSEVSRRNADLVSHFTPLGFYLDAIALVAPPAPSP